MTHIPSLSVEQKRPVRAEEAVEIALLLAFSGGYFDAYTWVVHGVMANTSIMVTGNLRLAIEGAIGVFSGRRDMLRRSYIFTGICVVFGMGAALGAFLAKTLPYLALGLPIIAMLVVLRILRR